VLLRYQATPYGYIIPGHKLTETCERQVGNNTRSWTVWSVIWRSWHCGGCTGCDRTVGPWSRSWWGDSRSSTAVVTTSVITTNRTSLTVGCVGYQNRWTLAECCHNVDETEARTTWQWSLWCGGGLAMQVGTLWLTMHHTM